jgi:hypothetical protein
MGLGGAQPSPADLQDFFSEDAENKFTAWDSVPPDSTFKQIEGLTPGQTWYFAVVAFDEAGAYEPRFLLDNNLLQFLPSTSLQAPKITLFNSFFSRTQPTGGIDLDERRVFRLEIPADVPMEFNWHAEPGAPGTLVTGYRWILDPIDGDIFDESPRENEDDVNRWSSWSISETRTSIGPFTAEVGEEVFPRFYVQARDNVGSISLMAVEVRVVPFDRDTANPLLIVDDYRAEPDRLVGGYVQPAGPFPGESVLDTLMYAIGGVPWREEPLGRTTSEPGVFAGFDFDTLDYRFFPFEGLPLSLLANYQTTVWLIAAEDAGRRGGKFTSNEPMSGLRFINSFGSYNTLAAYLTQGGGVWLIGDGVAPSIANGYVSRYGAIPFARYPLDSAGDAPSQNSILWPGNFLYDFMHARSQIELNTRDFFPTPKEYVDLVPYLPQFRTPGAPWPPVPGATPKRGSMDDMLTITTAWPDWPRRIPGSLDDISYISLPNFILENHDGDPGTPKLSRLDTLYLGRANKEIISTRPTESDGKPVFFFYWGDDHAGDICWTSVNLWMFERTQLQALAEVVLRNFGHHKDP